MKRFDVLDSWRGICAVLVVLYHFKATNSFSGLAFFDNAYLFVDFFFVLSGFVIFGNYANRFTEGHVTVKSFIFLRLARLYPLHIFMVIAFVGFDLAKIGLFDILGRPSPATNFDFSPDYSLIANIVLVHSLGLFDTSSWNVPSWSISTELYTCIGFALAISVAKERIWLVGLAALIICPLVILTFSPTGMDATYDYGIFRCVFGFSIGGFCWSAYKWTTRSDILSKISTPVMTGVELLAVVAGIVFVSYAGKMDLAILTPFLFGLVLLVFTQETGIISRFLSAKIFILFGTLSYSIYLTHFFIQHILLSAVDIVERKLNLQFSYMVTDTDIAYRVVGLELWQGNTATLLMLAITFCVSYITYNLVEEPARKWFRAYHKRTSKQVKTAQTT